MKKLLFVAALIFSFAFASSAMAFGVHYSGGFYGTDVSVAKDVAVGNDGADYAEVYTTGAYNKNGVEIMRQNVTDNSMEVKAYSSSWHQPNAGTSIAAGNNGYTEAYIDNYGNNNTNKINIYRQNIVNNEYIQKK